MKNPIETLDSILLKGANVGVKAWNWTTGRTKSDLADILNCVGTVASVKAFVDMQDYKVAGLIGVCKIIGTYFDHCLNKKIEIKEIKASEDGTLDYEVEQFKNQMKTRGLLCASAVPLSISTSLSAVVTKNPEVCKIGEAFTLYFSASGASNYVMRADNPPPRNNVLSRAKDKLSELVEKYKPSPQPVPSPAGA